MITNYVKMMCLSLIMTMRAMAQPQNQATEWLKGYPLEITYNKTSSIVFPTLIKSVDRGSRDVLVQKVKGIENVLQVKANRPNFPETNLTVITADGYLHQFTINYSDEPKSYRLEILGGDGGKKVIIFHTELTEAGMDQYAESIIQSKKSIRFLKEKKYNVCLALQGTYVKNNVMFFRLGIENTSNINYDIESLRFYIRDKAKLKRTASQEIEIKPLYVFGNVPTVEGDSSIEVVYIFEKFTIPDSKRLYMEMFEHKGGRHFNLLVKNRTIVKAQLLP